MQLAGVGPGAGAYMHTYICTYTHTYVNIHICIYVYIYVYIQKKFVFDLLCMPVYVYACSCVPGVVPRTARTDMTLYTLVCVRALSMCMPICM